MKTFSRIFVITFLLLWLAPFANLAFAQATTPGTPTPNPNSPQPNPNNPQPNPNNPPDLTVPVSLKNPFSIGNDLFEVMKALVNKVVLPIGGVLCVLGFIYAGFMYVTAGGNSTKIGEANRALLYSAVGTAVLLGAWVIANVIGNTIRELMTP